MKCVRLSSQYSLRAFSIYFVRVFSVYFARVFSIYFACGILNTLCASNFSILCVCIFNILCASIFSILCASIFIFQYALRVEFSIHFVQVISVYFVRAGGNTSCKKYEKGTRYNKYGGSPSRWHYWCDTFKSRIKKHSNQSCGSVWVRSWSGNALQRCGARSFNCFSSESTSASGCTWNAACTAASATSSNFSDAKKLCLPTCEKVCFCLMFSYHYVLLFPLFKEFYLIYFYKYIYLSFDVLHLWVLPDAWTPPPPSTSICELCIKSVNLSMSWICISYLLMIYTTIDGTFSWY